MKTQGCDGVGMGLVALANGAWDEAKAAFEQSLQQEQSSEAHEGLGWACWWQSDAPMTFAARERAYQLYRKNGDLQGAARMAIWIASDYVEFRAQLAIANGWRQRARRLLAGSEPLPEHGWLLVQEGAIAIEINNDTVTAKRCGAESAELGSRLGVIELEVIGIAMQGLALVSEGRIEEGTALLDEAMAAAIGGDLEQPFAIGWVTCYLIYACERMRDFERAAQWCHHMEELARRWRFSFWSGICRAHYAGVLVCRGSWSEAENELLESVEELQTTRPPYAVEGIVRLAELRRRQGRLDEAAELFAQVEEHPMALLGSAEIALDRGDPLQAEDLVQSFLRQIPEENRMQRLPALALLVDACIALGDAPRASSTLALMQPLVAEVATPSLLASIANAEGSVAIAVADYRRACERFEDAVRLYQRSGAPFETARARLQLANVLYALDRAKAAAKEARTAMETFGRIGALGEMERAEQLLLQVESGSVRKGGAARTPSLLTRREVEILQLVTRGLCDKEIAADLHISDHTVHRHVSNILMKLNVRSRAAAVARAAKENLL